MFFLVLADKYFDTLKDFTLKVLQHPSGIVREAMRKTADWLFVSLTARIHPFLYTKGKKLTTPEQIEARQQYIELVQELEFIIDKYDDGDRRVQYIDEMKPSVNKSLQYFWGRLTESRIYGELLEQTRPIPDEILEKRREIENKLTAILKESDSDFDLVDVKDVIYNANGQSSLTDLIKMFDNGQDLIGIENVLRLVNEAWNYFPHKTLHGLSPAEKFLEYQKSQLKSES